MSRDTTELWHSQEGVIRKINSLREFNRLFLRERLGNDGLLMVDEEGKITYANSKSLGLLGYSSQELVGRFLSDVLTPESLEAMGQLLPLYGQSGCLQRCELVFIDRQEAQVPAMVTSTNLFHQGQQAGSILVVSDLRNRRELVEDLKSIQGRLRDSSLELNKKLWELFVVKEVAHTLQTTLSLDEVLRIILTGVTAEQGLGFNRAFLVLMDEEAGCLRGKLAVGPSSPQEAERIWNGLKDQSFTLKELLERHRDASGQFDPGLNEIVKRMEFNLVPEGGIIARSVLEGKNFNVTEASKNPLVDTELLELLGTEAFLVVPLIARKKSLGAVIADNRFTNRPIEQADVELMETLANYASFAIERAHLYQQLTNKVHELERAYADLKDSQDQLLRSERLSAVGKMATRLTHEMRNPIVSLGGFVHRVSKNLPADDPNQEYMDIIAEEVARLEKLLTEVLDFARPAKPSLELVDLNELIQKVMATMQPEITGKQVAAQADLAPDLPKLHLDPLQINQVLMNLIRNGLEAMPSGGTLIVRTLAQGDRARVEVEDTGVGIPQEHLNKLFSEFFTTKSAGVGLGLAVAYQTVHNHKGSIGVHSQEGKGSTFFIDLPVWTEQEQH